MEQKNPRVIAWGSGGGLITPRLVVSEALTQRSRPGQSSRSML